MTIDKTADVKPAKDEKPEDEDEPLDEDGQPLKLKSPTVEKTGDVKEKRD